MILFTFSFFDFTKLKPGGKLVIRFLKPSEQRNETGLIKLRNV